MKWNIEYYEAVNNKCPVKDFIDGCTHEGKAKFIMITGLLEQYGVHIREPGLRQRS